MRILIGLTILALAASSGSALPPAPGVVLVLTVNSTNDPGDGIPDGTETTLREAVTAANANVGVTDIINFNIPSAPYTILLDSAIGVTDPVVIDGATQPGYVGTPLIELSNSTLSGFQLFLSGSSTVKAISFQGYPFNIGLILGGGGSLVQGCHFGTNSLTLLLSGTGIRVDGNDNVIGGTTAGSGNVFSRCGRTGIHVVPGVTGTVIQGNRIGTNAAGDAAAGNTAGIEVAGSGNTIGGTAAGARNVISGNLSQGILLDQDPLGGPAGSNLIQGNHIGTNAAGTSALGNGGAGIEIRSASNVIGGTAAGARNVISGNAGPGILLTGAVTPLNPGATLNQILGDYIGTDAAGTAGVGNGQGGIQVSDGAYANQVGSPVAGEGNRIAFNQPAGIWMPSGGVGNVVSGNSILSNSGLGIDLEALGVLPNDAGDYDAGPNRLQNAPAIISTINDGGGNTVVRGSLSAAPSSTHRVEYFSSASGDPSGVGEGETYRGFTDVVTDASGFVSWTETLAVPIPVVQVVTATATDFDGNTSEFSAGAPVTFETTPPAVAITSPTSDANLAVTAGTLDLGGTATDNVGVTGVTWVNSAGGAGGAVLAGTAWTLTGAMLTAGFNTFTVTAVDAQGNAASDTITVFYDASGPHTLVKKTTRRSLFGCGMTGLEGLLLSAAFLGLRRSVRRRLP